MKTPAAFLVLLLATASLARAANPTLTSAQVTLIIKDVKTIDPGKAGRDAVLKETVQGDQNVRTGIESRTELLFNDRTITRLGANTRFSFSEGTRNMSLDSGVMLLQVPKGIGGAKIETSAVTAGITGTTIMLEQSKKFTKLIVLEGDCWLIGKLANGKFTRRIVAHAGQEIIFPVGGPNMPPPVFINLKLLEATSLLLNGRWGVRLDMRPILLAANGQGNNFVPLNGNNIPGGLVTDTTGKLPPTQSIPIATPPPQPTPPPRNPIR
ncbi:MAG TPA: FecR family protein [Chthoniobacteraceae bacterium]|nr:FecR family protein [Chthoniobacteraceae bacterium]